MRAGPWLVRELRLVWPGVRAVVVLGGFAWANLWPGLRMAGVSVPDRVPPVRARARGPSGWSHGARLLSRQSAEHLHRTADRADARRRARPRGDAGGWPGCAGGLTMRVIDAEAVAALGWAAAIDAIRAAAVSDTATGVPPRTVVDVRAGQLLLMPADGRPVRRRKGGLDCSGQPGARSPSRAGCVLAVRCDDVAGCGRSRRRRVDDAPHGCGFRIGRRPARSTGGGAAGRLRLRTPGPWAHRGVTAGPADPTA